MVSKSMAFIVPTYNRANGVAYYLDKEMPVFAEKFVDVIIFDSSESDETKRVVEAYRHEHPEYADSLHYDYYCEGKADLRAIDRKVYTACKKYADAYAYLWLCGDGAVFHIETLWDDVLSAIQRKADCILLHDTKSRPTETCVYDSAEMLLKDYCTALTLLGSAIFSSECVREMVAQCPVITGDDFWLWLPLSFFHAKAAKEIYAEVVCNGNLFEINPHKGESFWVQNGDAFWQWTKVWPEAINRLPECYNDIKDEIIRKQSKEVLSIKGLLGLKASGTLTVARISAYRDDITKTTRIPLLAFYLIAALGNVKALAAIRSIYRRIRYKKGESIT